MAKRALPLEPRRWISPQLARDRARLVSGLHYSLELHIDPAAHVIRGRQQIDFLVRPGRNAEFLLLDWRPEDRAAASRRLQQTLVVNGSRASPRGVRIADGHLQLPHRLLARGRNRVDLCWSASIKPSGSALLRFHDSEDGANYVYTLFVPADASSIFPCFDQPDLKARFTLALHIPGHWQAIANAPVAASEVRGPRRVVRFLPTEPISTYAFAFAAGPFRELRSADARIRTGLWIRGSQVRRARIHADVILHLNERAMRYFERYFGHRFPFAKYDLVLIPEFSYRGMEHAGASFLAENATLLAATSGDRDRFERAQLIFHETAHQWLGDLVTMRSFDDLWIKEGFANFMAYKLATRLWPRAFAQVAFNLLKVLAYETDQGPGATALHRPLPDLAAAKSAYGHIVYGKAPALLRQWEASLGANRFRAGVRRFVRDHAYANAGWRDLTAALERASGMRLAHWARCWILRPGVPQIDVALRRDAKGRRPVLSLRQRTQHSVAWPLQLTTEFEGAHHRRHRIVADVASGSRIVALPRGVGEPVRAMVNADDRAYALVRMHAAELDRIAAGLAGERRALRRVQLWQALWQAVRDAELAPARFLGHVLASLGEETNEMILRSVLERTRTAIDRLLDPAEQESVAGRLDAMLFERLRHAPNAVIARAWFDGYIAIARTTGACKALGRILAARHRLWSVPIGDEDRFRAAAALSVRGIPVDTRRLLGAREDRGGGARRAFVLAAASPERANKRALLERYLAEASLAEDWIVASLPYFNHPAHAAATLPLLGPALRALPSLSSARKIFFVDRWVASFLGGQTSTEALALVQRFLDRRTLAPEIRAKVVEAAAELERAVIVRQRWTAAAPQGSMRNEARC